MFPLSSSLGDLILIWESVVWLIQYWSWYQQCLYGDGGCRNIPSRAVTHSSVDTCTHLHLHWLIKWEHVDMPINGPHNMTASPNKECTLYSIHNRSCKMRIVFFFLVIEMSFNFHLAFWVACSCWWRLQC